MRASETRLKTCPKCCAYDLIERHAGYQTGSSPQHVRTTSVTAHRANLRSKHEAWAVRNGPRDSLEVSHAGHSSAVPFPR